MEQNQGTPKWLWFGLIGCAVVCVCALLVMVAAGAIFFVTGTSSSQLFDPSVLYEPGLSSQNTPVPSSGDMLAFLNQHGGQPCAENTEFTCATLSVPLDHFDPANAETIDVVFAVLPATGERYGMYVQAFPGGPGGEGVSTAGTWWFSDQILEHYDIVYFDQRGLGLSGEITCNQAYAANFEEYLFTNDTQGQEGPDTPEEQAKMIADARKFVDACMAESGSAHRLQFYGTSQVAEDIETFRQAVGDEKFTMYGISYGTAVAQTYAAAHPDRLAGLILDGTVNLTLTGDQGSHTQEAAFDKVLVAVLKACDEDSACHADMGEDALAVYDRIAAQLDKNPITVQYPLPSGTLAARTLTFNEYEFATAYSMYGGTSRMMFLRALAAANQGDFVRLMRLLYSHANLNPETQHYDGDPTFSDTMFYSVHCTDNSYFSGTDEERIAAALEDGAASYGTVPRLDGSIYTTLTCVHWPSEPAGSSALPPLRAEGVPTFVLNATLDPATPFEEGKAVYENLADGYHIYVEGGEHGINFAGEECPTRYVEDFLLYGTLPAQRETVCQWAEPVFKSYLPLPDDNAAAYNDLLDLFSSLDAEMFYLPEFYFDDFSETKNIGCSFGGAYTMTPIENDGGATYQLRSCEFFKGLSLTGTGGFDLNTYVFNLNVDVSGNKSGHLEFTHDYSSGSYSLQGDYGGERIDLSQ